MASQPAPSAPSRKKKKDEPVKGGTATGLAGEGAEIHRMWDEFSSKYMQMSRALRRSLESEKVHVAAGRTLKDKLVEKALQLQAALNQKREDDRTIRALRDEARKAWTQADQARKREAEAKVLVDNLRKEIEELKTNLLQLQHAAIDERLEEFNQKHEAQVAAMAAHSPATPGGGAGTPGSRGSRGSRGSHDHLPSPGAASSRPGAGGSGSLMPIHEPPLVPQLTNPAVDALWSSPALAALSPSSVAVAGLDEAKPLTPFQEWKATHAIWTPDTPAGSLHHDPAVVAAYSRGVGTGATWRSTREYAEKTSMREAYERRALF